MLSSKTHFLLVTKLAPEQNLISLNHTENTQLDPFRFTSKDIHSVGKLRLAAQARKTQASPVTVLIIIPTTW